MIILRYDSHMMVTLTIGFLTLFIENTNRNLKHLFSHVTSNNNTPFCLCEIFFTIYEF